MINQGLHKARVQDWGVKHYADKDEYKIFVKFELIDAVDKGESYITWHGSLDDSEQTGRNGKSYTRLDFTRKNLKTLGYKYGEDLEAIISKPEPFDMQEVFQLDVQEFKAPDGKAITYVRGIESVDRPENNQVSGGPRKVEGQEASSFLSGLMKRNGMKVSSTPASAAPKAANAKEDFPDIPF